jgi:hypothetical protein
VQIAITLIDLSKREMACYPQLREE